MNEQEIRALVREAVERHLSGKTGAGKIEAPIFPHPSHVLLRVSAGGDVEEGMCVIEPAVRCTHCGFCKSYGH